MHWYICIDTLYWWLKNHNTNQTRFGVKKYTFLPVHEPMLICTSDLSPICIYDIPRLWKASRNFPLLFKKPGHIFPAFASFKELTYEILWVAKKNMHSLTSKNKHSLTKVSYHTDNWVHGRGILILKNNCIPVDYKPETGCGCYCVMFNQPK